MPKLMNSSKMAKFKRKKAMAVYFDNKIQAAAPGPNNLVEWHKSLPLLAVGSYNSSTGGTVHLYTEEGEHVSGTQLSRNVPPASLDWHPTRKILAIGWDNGEVVVWNEHEKELFNVAPIHKADISLVHWTSLGTRLLTADSSGAVLIWKADSRGRLQQSPISQNTMTENPVQVVLRPPAPPDPNNDLMSLARAAVSGDEDALDMFNWKKGNQGGQNGAQGANMRISAASLGNQEATAFFLGGQTGGVYYLNDNGILVEVFKADGPVYKLLYYDEKNMLVTVTSNMMLSQHAVTNDGETRELLKVKLSGKAEAPDIIWASRGIMAMATGEAILRMWDIDREENFILNLEGGVGYPTSDLLMCISYSTQKGMLSAGTGSGHIAMWKFKPALNPAVAAKQEPEDKWLLQPACTIDSCASSLTWGTSKSLLAVNTLDSVYILSEQIMNSYYNNMCAIVQTGPMQLSIDLYTNSSHQDLKTDIQIKGVCCTNEAIGIFDHKTLVVYEQVSDGSMVRSAGSFTTDSQTACIYEQNVYTVEPGKVQVRTFQGTVKQLLAFTEQEGNPIHLTMCNHYLVATTDQFYIKVYDCSRREAKQHGQSRNMAESIANIESLYPARCNSNATRCSVTAVLNGGKIDPCVYIWDCESNTVHFFNFECGQNDQDQFMLQDLGPEATADLTEADRGKNQAAKDVSGRVPMDHYWDNDEPKLLVVQARYQPSEEQTKAEQLQQQPQFSSTPLTKAVIDETVEMMTVSLFVTMENGILIQDSFPFHSAHNRLMGVQVPYYYFMKKVEEAREDSAPAEPNMLTGGVSHTPGFQKLVSRKIMRDFVGLENADKNARAAMMDFSFHLTIGNMDEAFKAIKLIKSESVWENMAKMCVKTRRLDVAMVCLGNMGHGRGAKMLREVMKEPQLDARVAVLAIQLNLLDDAERLLKNAKRYDLLNDFYQSTDSWEKALETAEMYDRVHLRTTYYNYAKHLESKGDFNGAIPNYEKSDTHRFEVPRMLFDEPQALEGYIMKIKDKALRKWWAQYLESTGEMETALQFYEAAQDVLSLVRVQCYCGNLDKGAEICNETGDKAACYHLARQYENNDQIKEAINFFNRAGAYGNAIRLCKDNGMEDQMMNLALMGKSDDMITAARYYEQMPGGEDKAVMLYHGAGHFSKALELAFNSKQFAALQTISQDLDDKTDPALLKRCADFFIENGHFDRAVDLLAIAGKYWDALKLCAEQHVQIDEALCEKLTPDGDEDLENRNKILEGIAEVCMQQRQYHIATKKFTQSGNKVKAMKALLKSGDTEKIVFFAGVSRQKEIYIMAANYLQSLDWRNQPEIMKNIIGFYTKGRALDLLAGFYDACAQVEIDEFQNYDKALGALSEAHKCLGRAKVKNPTQQEERLEDMQNRINLIKKYVVARRTYDEDADEAINQCQALLQEVNTDSIVRLGDVYAFIIHHYAKREKWKVAYNCIEDLRNRAPKTVLHYFIQPKALEAIYKAMDMAVPSTGGNAPNINGFSAGGQDEDGEQDGEFVDEEVLDEDD